MDIIYLLVIWYANVICHGFVFWSFDCQPSSSSLILSSFSPLYLTTGDANSGSNVEFELDQSVPSTSTGGETLPATQAGSALAESYQLLAAKAAAD